ncbi:MAG: hypothetical protein WC850_03875 [Candidatus Gracilibacteria bacterium]
METKKLELFIVIVVILYLLYFLSYLLFFDNYCYKFSGTLVGENANMGYLAKCKDSLVCEITNKITENNQLKSWTCAKKRYNNFEIDYYISKFK